MKRMSIVVVAALVLSGCVSAGKYDEAVARATVTEAKLGKTTAALHQSEEHLEQQRRELVQLGSQLSNVSKSSDALKFATVAQVAELEHRLAELKAAQAASDARAALYKDLTLRLKRQIDDGNLSLVVRDGRMVLQLPNDVLFDSGRTELKPAGKKALEAVAEVMRSIQNRHFQVAGHTDNVPIRNAPFASNWELSTGRALGVVHYLTSKGVDPQMLSAAGYSDVDPIAKNDSNEGKKKNRRTEITLQPNIDELVKIP